MKFERPSDKSRDLLRKYSSKQAESHSTWREKLTLALTVRVFASFDSDQLNWSTQVLHLSESCIFRLRSAGGLA